MSEPIRTEKRGKVLEVTIDRPKANAIDAATSRIMGDVFAAFRDDAKLRAAILTATGERFFCPGWDLKAAAAGEEADADYGVGGFGGLQELAGLGKPVVCAVNGLAFGGGFEIMISCDIIIAAEHPLSRFPRFAPASLPMPPPSSCRAAFPITSPWRCCSPAASSMPPKRNTGASSTRWCRRQS